MICIFPLNILYTIHTLNCSLTHSIALQPVTNIFSLQVLMPLHEFWSGWNDLWVACRVDVEALLEAGGVDPHIWQTVCLLQIFVSKGN